MLEKLLRIQMELKAPKGQFNSFGNYAYRSCEDILEAVKPILEKEGLVLTLTDELVQIGERYYVKATATLFDTDGEKKFENIAYAREEENKKGMDGSQITGASSSYARKYALNGLFLIDDVKDSDTTNVGDNEPTIEDAKKYAINFGKKHPGELLVDVYKNDYSFIEWILEKKQDDTYLIKCINLLDKEEPSAKNIKTDDERLELIVKFEKLLIQSKTDKESVYSYFEVNNNTEMTNDQLKEAIQVLEKKVDEM